MHDLIQNVLDKYQIVLYHRIDKGCNMAAAVCVRETNNEFHDIGLITCFIQVGLRSPCPCYIDLVKMKEAIISDPFIKDSKNIPIQPYCIHHALSILKIMHSMAVLDINHNKYVDYNTQAAAVFDAAMMELSETSIKHSHSAQVIQRMWLKKYYDPNEAICKRRLVRELDQLKQV